MEGHEEESEPALGQAPKPASHTPPWLDGPRGLGLPWTSCPLSPSDLTLEGHAQGQDVTPGTPRACSVDLGVQASVPAGWLELHPAPPPPPPPAPRGWSTNRMRTRTIFRHVEQPASILRPRQESWARESEESCSEPPQGGRGRGPVGKGVAGPVSIAPGPDAAW